ncbi:DinB family protein [Pontimicrobium sp. SW4]|uniref:DinB family protein n=1 Tax=Pontimicrobium sp. SW4 TaxID=3153519 RepID=A0AAU7BT87_9FLAO
MEYSIDKALEILERTPKILKSYLENLSDEWIFCNEGDETWSAFDIVGHLIHGEKTDWIPRLKIVLNDSENKTFEPYDRFAQFEESKGKSARQLLEEFSNLRQQNIKFLKSINISEADFNEKAFHPSLGEVTLKNLLATWVTHDLGHIAQISRVMAKQYKDEVGPWIEYISILNK